ncbi:hypothetical protein PQX77_014116 [Marasmius sp. AFHP31]|nr:hypothetical protein PQX77_014116 [Marasmius sp. AFHP31]
MAHHRKEVSLRMPHDRSDNSNVFGGATREDELFSPAPASFDVERLALRLETKWRGNGVRLRVAFIDKPAPARDVQKHILGLMNCWSHFCNARFTLLDYNPSRNQIAAAEVRISFSGKPTPGIWSRTGTDLISLSTNKLGPTMMLTGINTPSLSKYATSIGLHETGHILGFRHEHCRKEFIEQIDSGKAYRYYKEKHPSWTETDVKHNLLTALGSNGSTYSLSKPDPRSIMCYGLLKSIMKKGKDPVPGYEDDLSSIDQEHAADSYPIPEYESKIMPTDKDTVGMTAWGKEFYFLTRNNKVKGHFKLINGRGECTWYISVYGGKSEQPLAEKTRDIGTVNDAKETTLIPNDRKLFMLNKQGEVLVWRGSDVHDTREWTKIVDKEALSNHNIKRFDHVRGKANYFYDRTGGVWMYWLGRPNRHWRVLCNLAGTRRICSTDNHLYRLTGEGEIYQISIGREGKPDTDWLRIQDKDAVPLKNRIVRIRTNSRHLYQQRENGEIWVYAGTGNYWMKMYPPRLTKGSDVQMPEPSDVKGIKAQGDRFFIMFDTPRDEKTSGVWVNDNNTDQIASKVGLELERHKGIRHVVGGWKPLQIRRDWSDFVYTQGYVYAFVKRTGEVTRYTGIC